MPNILKVTTPAAGYDNNSIKNNPTPGEAVQIKNPVDPSKVLRGDNRTDAGQDQNKQLELNYESNFENFIRMVKEAPQLTRVFAEWMAASPEELLNAGANQAFIQEAEGFFQLIQPGEEGVAALFKEQVQSSVRFTGPFFQALRQVMGQSRSVDLRFEILDFIRKYNDMASGRHLLGNMKGLLDEIGGGMFLKSRQELEALAGKLDLQAPPGQVQENALLLKQQIVPFLGRYVTASRDMGKLRDLVSALLPNIARYENGSLEEVVHSFKRLLAYPGFRKAFGTLDEGQFREALQSADFDREAGKNLWSEGFCRLLEMGVKGEAGMESKAVFDNLMHSVLLNESVYVPLLHLYFPLSLGGRRMFSEVWVDGDAKGGQEADPAGRAVKLFIKFHIQDLGSFQMILLYEKERLNMHLSYPEKLSAEEGQIRKGMGGIMEKNHLELQGLALEKGGRQRSLVEVFPKIFEKRSTVNVRI